MNPFGNLSEENGDQIKKYLRFFRQKREGMLRAIANEFGEIKSDRLSESMYSKDDAEELVDFIESSVRNQVSAELGSIINMGALSVSQLLESAQDKGLEISLETASLENQAVLEAVEKLSFDAMPKNPRRGVGELVSFKDEARAKREEADRIESTNRRLQEEVNSLRTRLAAAEQLAAQSSRAADSKRGAEDSSRGQIRDLERALAECKEEGNKRVSETSQFQQMKKLMQSQSDKIRELRRRLERYEPDSAKDDDGDV